jgi:hypothetical protein
MYLHRSRTLKDMFEEDIDNTSELTRLIKERNEFIENQKNEKLAAENEFNKKEAKRIYEEGKKDFDSAVNKVYICVYIYIHMYMFIYVHIYMCIYVYLCVYMCTYT